ncbi:MAG: D-alanyl-D-alanine carboxypeptidase [Firmicutes bacterium]|nr:D-alanyl-D-alanine carboxypeptidase [Bacillota bacterium]
MKRLISLILTLCVILGLCAAPASALTDLPTLKAESAILIDLRSGDVLFEKDADSLRYPASTTKMVTAILAIEKLSMDDVITADATVASTGGSRLGLKNGDQMTVKDALYAMLIGSANDCASLLAKAMAGSDLAFAEMMNQKLLEIGTTSTHFVNPHGLHDDDHYTTARDLAIIASYCMQNEIFADIVSRESYDATVNSGGSSSVKTVETTNLLLNDEKNVNRIYVYNNLRYCKYDGCIGVKTGNTSEAGACLIAAAERDNTRLLCVALKSESMDRFADCIKMLDWGFENYKTVHAVSAGTDCGEIKVRKGEFNKVGTVSQSDYFYTIPVEGSEEIISKEIKLQDSVKAPVAKGTAVGTIEVYESGNKIGSVPVVTAGDINEGGFLSNFGVEDATAKKILTTILVIIILLILALAGYIIFLRWQMKKKKAAKAARLKAKKEDEARRRAMWDKERGEK